MDQSLGIHALAHAGFAHDVRKTLLEHAGSDPAEYVLSRLLLEDDVVDARLVQQLTQEQPGRAGTDDRDLCPRRQVRRSVLAHACRPRVLVILIFVFRSVRQNACRKQVCSPI